METPHSRRQQPPTPPSPSPSPRLLRSRSGSSATTLPPTTSPSVGPGISSSTSQRFTNVNRSKSTTRPRPSTNNNNNNYYYYYNNNNNFTTTKKKEAEQNKVPNYSSAQKNKSQETKDQLGFAKFLQRGTLRGFGATKGSSANTKSPSAWALSPARSLPFGPNSPAAAVGPDLSPGLGRISYKAKSNNIYGGGAVNGVLKYFRSRKKVCPIQEEDFHRFRILHNGLLQLRFANARAEAAMASTKRLAESKLFSVWLRIFKMRSWVVEKRILMQTLKHEIKVYQILNPHVLLLNEWSKLERRNQESVGKLVAKLSGLSLRLPLIHGAKADLMSVYEEITTAVDAINGIEEIITKFSTQVERILYMVTELLITKKQHKENLEELEKTVNYVSTLAAKETSIRANYIEAALESMRCQKY